MPQSRKAFTTGPRLLPLSVNTYSSHRNVHLRLMEKTQDLDPFRFFLYGAQIDLNTAQFSVPKKPQDAE